MKIKKRDLLRLYNAISLLEGRPFSVKFSYFIAKNKVAMRDEISALDVAKKVTDGFKSFDNERAKLAQKFADKNEDGSAKIQHNSFVITTNADLFQEELSILREEHADIITDREKQIEEFENLLDEDVDFKGLKLDFKDIPESIEPSMLEPLILADLIIDKED